MLMPKILKPGDRVIRSAGQTLIVNWAVQSYVVSEETMRAADYKRACWICGGVFRVGDGMTVVNTDIGNKVMHRRCWEKQCGNNV